MYLINSTLSLQTLYRNKNKKGQGYYLLVIIDIISNKKRLTILITYVFVLSECKYFYFVCDLN